MKTLIWKLIEPLVEAAITNRLLQFHAALLSRGQIAAGTTEPPAEEN